MRDIKYAQLMGGLTPSKYQIRLFKFIEAAQGSAVVNAVAGSSKTTSIVAAAKLLPLDTKAVFLAFNKTIAEELQRKLPPHVKAMTTHSLCFRAMGASGTRFKVESDKLSRMMSDLLSVPEKMLRGQIRKLVGMAKANGMVPNSVSGMAKGLVPDTPEFWQEIIATYSIDLENDWQEEIAIARAKDLLRMSIDNRDGAIDFDDMLFLPVVLQMPFPKFDWVFVDELQDLSSIQHEIVRRITRPTSHVIGVGDKFQSCYAFRGADTESMSRFAKAFNAKELALSICYRCPKSVVAEAKKLVPEIEHAPGAEEGVVSTGVQDLSAFTSDSVVVCPYNAPLIEAAYTFIRAKIACRVLGRELGEGLVKLVRKLERDGASNVRTLEKYLQSYYYEELERLEGKEVRQNALTDKVETLQVFLGEAAPNETIDRFAQQIESLFTEKSEGMLTLSSVHRSKGLQYEKVFFLNAHFLEGDSRKGKKMLPWELQQRQNLRYVAITRAKKELHFITSEDLKRLAEKGQPNGTQTANPVRPIQAVDSGMGRAGR